MRAGDVPCPLSNGLGCQCHQAPFMPLPKSAGQPVSRGAGSDVLAALKKASPPKRAFPSMPGGAGIAIASRRLGVLHQQFYSVDTKCP